MISSSEKDKLQSVDQHEIPSKSENTPEKEKNKLSEYQFSYISSSEFNSIFKQVRRERQKKQEAKDWERFLLRKQANESNFNSSENMKSDAFCDPCPCFDCKQSKEIQFGGFVSEGEKCPKPQLMKIPMQYNSPELDLEKPNLKNQNDYIKKEGLNDTKLENETTQNPVLPRIKQEIVIYDHKNESDVCLKAGSTRTKSVRAENDKKYTLKKLENSQRKIIMALNGIERAINNTYLEETSKPTDVNRRKKLNTGFTVRFRKNYNYQLDYQLWEIEKLIKSKSEKARQNAVFQRLLISHQIISQALQAVERYILMAYPIEQPLFWLQEFVSAVYHLSVLLVTFDSQLDKYSDDVKIACEDLLETIIEFNKKLDKGKLRQQHFRKPKLQEARKYQDNLWMYKTRYNKKTNSARTKSTKCFSFSEIKRVE